MRSVVQTRIFIGDHFPARKPRILLQTVTEFPSKALQLNPRHSRRYRSQR